MVSLIHYVFGSVQLVRINVTGYPPCKPPYRRSNAFVSVSDAAYMERECTLSSCTIDEFPLHPNEAAILHSVRQMLQ